MTALFGELPNFPFSYGLLATGQFCEGDLQIVMSQQFLSLLWLQCPNLGRCLLSHAGHQERPIDEVVDAFGAPRGEQTPVSSEECVGRRVEQVCSQGDGHGEEHRVAASKHMDGPLGREKWKGGHHDLRIVLVALLFHDGHNPADGMDSKGMGTHELSADVA